MNRFIFTLLCICLGFLKTPARDWDKFKEDLKKKIDKEVSKCVPLHDAAKQGDIPLMQKLVSEGANVNELSCFWKMTPIQHVLFINKPGQIPPSERGSLNSGPIVKWLLENGAAASIEQKDSGFDRTALHLAGMYNHKDAVALLCSYGANKSARDIDGATPLLLAAGQNSAEAVDQLLIAGTDINQTQKDPDMTIDQDPQPKAIHMAALKAAVNVLKVLIEKHHQSIETPDYFQATPLHYAAEGLDVATIQYLLDKGASKKAKDSFGKTPLGYATRILKSNNADMTTEEMLANPAVKLLQYQ